LAIPPHDLVGLQQLYMVPVLGTVPVIVPRPSTFRHLADLWGRHSHRLQSRPPCHRLHAGRKAILKNGSRLSLKAALAGEIMGVNEV
jgi:hypothetical protein